MTKEAENENNTNPTNLTDYRSRKIASEITSIYEAIVGKQTLKKIPEQTFINEILPFYAGEATSGDIPLLVAAAAGSPFLEFEVIDQAGNVLFKAPPLLERKMFSTKEYMRTTPLEAVFITADRLANRSPYQAEHFMEQQLTKKSFSKDAAEIYRGVIARREEILQRYGKAHVSNVGVNSTGVVNTNSTNKPEIDFDDSEIL